MSLEQEHKIVNIIPTSETTNNTLNTVLLTEQTEEDEVKQQEISDYKAKISIYIKLLSDNDYQLIDPEYIYNRGHYYINEYKIKYQPYIEKLNEVTSKFYNRKKYSFDNNNKSFNVLLVAGDNKETKIVKSLEKPKTMNVIEYLKKACNIIQRERSRMEYKYNILLHSNGITQGDINGFNKKRNFFINKLNEYYAIEYYYNRININSSNFKNIAITNLINGKLRYDNKLIQQHKYINLVENDINIRKLYINALIEGNKGSIKEYLIHKIKGNKHDEKLKNLNKNINIIVLEKDIITKNKFNFTTSSNISNSNNTNSNNTNSNNATFANNNN